MDVDDYLNRHIEEYLFCDIQAIVDNIKVSPDGLGGVGYPVVMALCSGVEFLGSLTYGGLDEEFNRNFGEKYFSSFLNSYLSRINENYAKFSTIIYKLLRHGIAHNFNTKSYCIGIIRDDGAKHLKTEDSKLIIDGNQFFLDIKLSYEKYAKPDITRGGVKYKLAQHRLNKILELNNEDTKRLFEEIDTNIQSIPIMHTGLNNDGPSGPIFTAS